jgi:transforming growth factor-beta-induced protein
VKPFQILFLTALVLGAAVFLVGCTAQTPEGNVTTTETPTATPVETPGAGNQTIVDIAVANGNFTTLVAALEAAGLADTLAGPGPYTVFAPTDEAFDNLTPETVSTLLADPQGDLTEILLYHVAEGKLMASDVAGMTSIETLQGSMLPVEVNGTTVMVDNATVIQADIEASNGVIHVIDAVMIPPNLGEGNATPASNMTG